MRPSAAFAVLFGLLTLAGSTVADDNAQAASRSGPDLSTDPNGIPFPSLGQNSSDTVRVAEAVGALDATIDTNTGAGTGGGGGQTQTSADGQVTPFAPPKTTESTEETRTSTAAQEPGKSNNSAEQSTVAAHTTLGTIVGCVVGGVVLIGLLLGLFFFLRQRSKKTAITDVEQETRESLVNEGFGSPSGAYGVLAGGYPDTGSSTTTSRELNPVDFRASMHSASTRALEDSIAADAFERAKAQASQKAEKDVAAVTYRHPEGGEHAMDADDQAPPYWLTAGEEFGDSKHQPPQRATSSRK